jgi:hypothetical protein
MHLHVLDIKEPLAPPHDRGHCITRGLPRPTNHKHVDTQNSAICNIPPHQGTHTHKINESTVQISMLAPRVPTTNDSTNVGMQVGVRQPAGVQ